MKVWLSLLCDPSVLFAVLHNYQNTPFPLYWNPTIIIYATGCLYSLQLRVWLTFNTHFCYELLSDLSTGRIGPQKGACLWGPYKGEEFSRTPGPWELGWGGETCSIHGYGPSHRHWSSTGVGLYEPPQRYIEAKSQFLRSTSHSMGNCNWSWPMKHRPTEFRLGVRCSLRYSSHTFLPLCLHAYTADNMQCLNYCLWK